MYCLRYSASRTPAALPQRKCHRCHKCHHCIGALATLAILAPVLHTRAPSTWLSCLAPWHLGALTPVLASRAPGLWHLGQVGILLGLQSLLRPLDAAAGPTHSSHLASCLSWLSWLAFLVLSAPSSSPAPAPNPSKIVNSVTVVLAALALLAPFKHRCGFWEEGQTLPWPSSTPHHLCDHLTAGSLARCPHRPHHRDHSMCHTRQFCHNCHKCVGLLGPLAPLDAGTGQTRTSPLVLLLPVGLLDWPLACPDHLPTGVGPRAPHPRPPGPLPEAHHRRGPAAPAVPHPRPRYAP